MAEPLGSRCQTYQPIGPSLVSTTEANVARLVDAAAVRSHLERLRREAPELVALYRVVTAAQLPMARVLAEGTLENYRQIAGILAKPRVSRRRRGGE